MSAAFQLLTNAFSESSTRRVACAEKILALDRLHFSKINLRGPSRSHNHSTHTDIWARPSEALRFISFGILSLLPLPNFPAETPTTPMASRRSSTLTLSSCLLQSTAAAQQQNLTYGHIPNVFGLTSASSQIEHNTLRIFSTRPFISTAAGDGIRVRVQGSKRQARML